MAKGKKTGGRNIKHGQVLNPLGRPRVPEIMRAVRTMTQQEVAEVGSMLLERTLKELRAIHADPLTSAFKAVFAKAIVRAYENADMGPVDRLLDRIIGRVKDTPDVEMKRFIEKLEKLKAMPIEERIRLANRAIQKTQDERNQG